MNDGGQTVPRITRAEHVGPNDTGDNIEAKRVVLYGWNPTGLDINGQPNGAWERYTGAAIGGATSDNQIIAQGILDELSSLVNKLGFLSALQTPTGELKVTLFQAGANNLTGVTLGAVTSVTNQVSSGGFSLTQDVISSINTEVNTGVKANIISS